MQEHATSAATVKSRLEEIIGKRMSPSEFARFYFDWEPIDYQTAALDCMDKKTLLLWARQTGKSTVAAMKALWYALWHDGATVLILSPKQRQSNRLFKKIRDFITISARKFPELNLATLVDRETQTIIEFFNGSEIIAMPVPDTGDNIRGFTAHMIIIDEVANIKDEAWSAINPMLIVTHGSLLIISTPKGTRNFFYEAYRNEKLKYNSFGPVTSYDNPMSDREQIEADKERMTEFEWREEYMAEFIDERNAMFPISLIDGCTNPNMKERDAPLPNADYYLGVDPARHGKDRTVLCVVERTPLATLAVKFFESRDDSIPEIVGRIKRLNMQWNFKKILVDETGIGGGVSDFLTRDEYVNVEGFLFTIKTKEEIFMHLQRQMAARNVIIPKNPKLRKELSDMRYEETNLGYLKIFAEQAIRSANNPGGDDYPTALALAMYALRKPMIPLIYGAGKGVLQHAY